MSSIHDPPLAESTSMNEGELKEGSRAMLQQPDHAGHDDIASSWPDHGRGVMSHHDRFIPKQLLLFDPLPLSYSRSIFLPQDQQEQESEQLISGGFNDTKICDHGVISDHPIYPSEEHGMINCHDQWRDHGHVVEGRDPPPHQYGRHRHGYREQRRFSRDCGNYNNNQVRTCVDCNTTKTPLWRSGPLGPKSLCNACGIRHHKARRARAAASASALQSGENFCFPPIKSKNKEKNSDRSKRNSHYKRKNRIFPSQRGRKRICLDLNINCEVGDDDALDQYAAETTETELDLSVEASESKPFTRVFPKDEEQAAILLMALSCGLVHGRMDLR